MNSPCVTEIVRVQDASGKSSMPRNGARSEWRNVGCTTTWSNSPVSSTSLRWSATVTANLSEPFSVGTRSTHRTAVSKRMYLRTSY